MIIDLDNFNGGNPTVTDLTPEFNDFIQPFKTIVAGFSEKIQFSLISTLCRWLLPNISELAKQKGWNSVDIYAKKHLVELECTYNGTNEITATLRAEGFQIAEMKITNKKGK